MRISDWSSDVCSSDLPPLWHRASDPRHGRGRSGGTGARCGRPHLRGGRKGSNLSEIYLGLLNEGADHGCFALLQLRSEEHTSELQSLMRSSYAVFCLQKKTNHQRLTATTTILQLT